MKQYKKNNSNVKLHTGYSDHLHKRLQMNLSRRLNNCTRNRTRIENSLVKRMCLRCFLNKSDKIRISLPVKIKHRKYEAFVWHCRYMHTKERDKALSSRLVLSLYAKQIWIYRTAVRGGCSMSVMIIRCILSRQFPVSQNRTPYPVSMISARSLLP